MTNILIKIRKVSIVFRWLFIISFVVVPLAHIISWANAPDVSDISGKFGLIMNPLPPGVKILHPLSHLTQFYGFLIGAVPLVWIECILYFLIQLFRLYEQGEIFSLLNVKYIKKIGYSLMIYELADVVCDGLLTFILTLGNPPGFRTIGFSLSGINATIVFLAFMIILISWIMTEGCRLREEQNLTI